jgi:energy-coupling factor transporter ATP-binding protein EcfA2
MCADLYAKEFAEVKMLLAARKSVLLVGEAGSGKTTFAHRLLDQMSEMKTAIASYEGSSKQTLKLIAQQLNVPTINEKNRPLNTDDLKEAIAAHCDSDTLLVCDNCHRWPSSLRYWVEGLHAQGVILLLLAIEDMRKDIFVRVSKMELAPPSEQQIRQIMAKEANEYAFSLSPSKLAHLQQLAGSNPMIAKNLIQEARLGRHFPEGQHNQYINVAPFINGILVLLGVFRFLGLGLGDRALYVFGGIAMLVAISFRYIGIGLNKASRRKPLGKK